MIASATSNLNFGEVDNETVRKVPDMLEKFPTGHRSARFGPGVASKFTPKHYSNTFSNRFAKHSGE